MGPPTLAHEPSPLALPTASLARAARPAPTGTRANLVQLLEEERLRKEIAELRAKIERVPFTDTFDLRYKKITKNGRSLPARR